MYSAGLLGSLIGQIYDAAVDDTRWPAFLVAFADATRGGATQLIHHGHQGKTAHVDVSMRLDPEARDQYDRHFGHVDPWLKAGLQRGLIREGAVFVGQALVPHHELKRTTYYNEFASGFEVTRSLAAVACMDAMGTCSFTTTRSDRDPEFGEAELQLLRLLTPHLQRAIDIHRRIHAASLANATSMEVLNRLSAAVIAVGADGKVKFANQSASAFLASEDGVKIRCQRLVTDFHADGIALDDFVRCASTSVDSPETRRPRGIRVRRLSAKPSLHVFVVPLNSSVLALPEAERIAALVFITLPEGLTLSKPDLLRQMFGLTRTEAAVVLEFAHGLGLPEIADKLALTDNTVRWHFKHILAKTDCSSQSALARLLTGLAIVTDL